MFFLSTTWSHVSCLAPQVNQDIAGLETFGDAAFGEMVENSKFRVYHFFTGQSLLELFTSTKNWTLPVNT